MQALSCLHPDRGPALALSFLLSQLAAPASSCRARTHDAGSNQHEQWLTLQEFAGIASANRLDLTSARMDFLCAISTHFNATDHHQRRPTRRRQVASRIERFGLRPCGETSLIEYGTGGLCARTIDQSRTQFFMVNRREPCALSWCGADQEVRPILTSPRQ
jgi:hypothetical protein